jgi:hypothetical protein
MVSQRWRAGDHDGRNDPNDAEKKDAPQRVHPWSASVLKGQAK